MSRLVALTALTGNQIKATTVVVIVLMFCRCGVQQTRAKYTFADGYYQSNIFDSKGDNRVYVHHSQDSILIFKITGRKENRQVTGTPMVIAPLRSDGSQSRHMFRQGSFDFDFLTIPFKYRGSTDALPRQFNTNLNGVLYIGHRVDAYLVKFRNTPFSKQERRISHLGLSYGVFSGFGGTAINPWVTRYQVSSEYDGVVWSKGLAAIIGIDNISLGLALGFDNLLDQNRRWWIYENHPWFGLAFGLNLN